MSDLAPFWDAVAERRLVLQHCCECGDVQFPPTPVCPKCLSEAREWREASGHGTLQSWATFHRAYWDRDRDRLPYDVCLIALEEGPLMISNLAEEHAALRVGAPVHVVFRENAEGKLLPNFVVDG